MAKGFWLRRGLDQRLARVVRARRRGDRSYTERRALEAAVRLFVEREEQAIGAAGLPPAADLVESLMDVALQLRGRFPRGT